MFSSISMLQFALLIWPFLGFTRAQTAYESIYTLDAFDVQQTCVQSCFIQGYANIQCYTDVLGSMLGCPNSPCSSTFAAMDGCYCRGDLQPAAHDLLSACIDELCSVGDKSVILATAASIYSGYCTSRGLKAAAPAQNTADTTSQSSFSAPTTPSIRIGATSSSSTSPTNTPSTLPASTNITMKIVLGSLGGVTVIALVVAVICCLKMRWRKIPAKPTPYYFDPLPNSSHYLYPEVLPSDSVSQIGQSSLMGPSYPPQSDPSTFSTTVNGDGRSMFGRGQNAPNQRYG